MRFLISDDELAALDGLPWAARLLYLMGLRPHMDYATGLVGTAKRRISLQQLREALFVEPGAGRSESGSPSKDQVRRALHLLTRAGLVERQDEPGRLVFRLPLAAADVYPKGTDTESPRIRQGEAAREPATAEAPPVSESEGVGRQGIGTEPPGGDEGEPATPPGSGVRDKPRPTTAGARASASDDEHVPADVREWVAVMTNTIGYDPGQAWNTRKAVPMYQRWVAAGVTVGDARLAAQAAEGKLGELPAPSYLADMALEAKTAREAGEVVPIGAGPNSGGQGHGARDQGARPRSAFERVMAGAEAAQRGGQLDDE